MTQDPREHAPPFPEEIAVPFNRPSLTGRELEYMTQAVRAGHLSADGPFTKRCQALLEEVFGVHRVFLTTSGTHALEMSALLSDVGPDDEVIVPSFTFSSTAAAFALRGATLIFADIRPDTFNLDESQLASLVTPRTRVIVPVHYGGVACEMDKILEVGRDSNAWIVEDAAHALSGSYRDRLLGTFGKLSTLSFHETKNITSGEGGALLVNDPALVERAERIWHKGTNRLSYFRGEVDRYTWVELGSSFAPSDLLAAFLLAQLDERAHVTARRRAIWDQYFDWLGPWAERNGVRMQHVPAHCEPSYHLFSLLFPDREQRDRAITGLKERGIVAPFHYVPLHSSPMGLRFGRAPQGCPVTDDVADRLVRLPFYNTLDRATQERVVNALEEVFR